MKKSSVLFFIMFLLPVLLAACGKTAETGINVRKSAEAASQAPAAAENPKEAGLFEARSEDGVIDIPDFGMKITLPEQVKDLPVYAVGYKRHDFAFINLCLTDTVNPDNGGFVFGEIFAFPEEQSHASLTGAVAGLTEDMITDLGTNGVLIYYAMRLDEVRKTTPESIDKLAEGLSEAQKPQYDALLKSLPEIYAGAELTKVVLPEKTEEPVMNLRMPDLEGNEVRMGDLISKNKVTMLNAWGITCGPCMMEMPSLIRLREKYKDQGFEIIGVTSDLLDSDGSISSEHIAEAKEVTASLGVDYPVLAATMETLTMLKVYVVPTTWFVNSSGMVIGKAVMGARSAEQWDQIISQVLAAVE